MQTYLFYDIETTGLNKAFDQVLQFAAIRTDTALQELARYEVQIKLNPDIIPSPHALLAHEINIDQMFQGEQELTAIKKIHGWLNTPGTISLGYNSLGFDDEFLRFSFYRNLLPPYHHQFKNQCSRMDIYPMTLYFFLFKKHLLTWPASFKLADLQTANNLAKGRAHQAMVDVEATLALARILLKERDTWTYLHGFFNKEIDQKRMQPLQNVKCIMIDGRLREQNFQSAVLSLGHHKYYKNQMVFLRLDFAELKTCTLDSFLTHTRTTNKKLGEPNFILPFSQHSLPDECVIMAENNMAWLLQHPDIFAAISDYYTNYQYPVYPQTDVDAGLYLNGFWTAPEEHFCRMFHTVNENEKTKLLQTLSNQRLQELTLRIMGRHYFDALPEQQRKLFTQYLEQMHNEKHENAPIDFQGRKRLTCAVALQEVAELRQQGLPDTKARLLDGLEHYIKEKSRHFDPVIGPST